MIAVARSSFSAGACAATSALPRRTASSKARTSSSPKPRPETSARASSASPSTIEMCRRSRPASSSSFTTLRTTSASKTLATVVAIVRSPRYGMVVGWDAGASARRVVPGVGGVEALDDGLLPPERDPLLGVAGGGPPRDPDLLGGAQALLDHHHLLVEGDDGRVALLARRDGGVDPAVERPALDLDLLDGERRVDDLLGRPDLGPHPHRTRDLPVLADHGPLLDHWHSHPLGGIHPLRGTPPRHPWLSSAHSGTWRTVRRRGMFRGGAAEICRFSDQMYKPKKSI